MLNKMDENTDDKIEKIAGAAEEISVDETLEPIAENARITSLRVKADSKDITPEERKRNVKKLAGAISHSLRSNGEICVRAFGANSVSKAAKAITISNDYIGVQNLNLSFSPSFITTIMGDKELTGIGFVTFASEKTDADNINEDDIKATLKVKADPKDISDEDRKNGVKSLAASMAYALEENREIAIRCVGSNAIYKCLKAMIVARTLVAAKGYDLYARSRFIVVKIGDIERTGIKFIAFTNQG